MKQISQDSKGAWVVKKHLLKGLLSSVDPISQMLNSPEVTGLLVSTPRAEFPWSLSGEGVIVTKDTTPRQSWASIKTSLNSLSTGLTSSFKIEII